MPLVIVCSLSNTLATHTTAAVTSDKCVWDTSLSPGHNAQADTLL